MGLDDKRCKRCLQICEGEYSEATESHELVVVYEKTHDTIILNKGDCLCKHCSSTATYYRRVR